MSKQKILISQIKNVTDIKSHNLKGIESSKQKIFGYLKNMPGEKNWIKPLMGKSLQNYYFPSKYLHLDFNLKEYLRMQTVRFNKKNIDGSLLKLQECINIIIENKEVVENFFSKISKKLLIENQSLKDFYFLYLTVFPQKVSSFFPSDDSDINLKADHFSWFTSNDTNGVISPLITNSDNTTRENKTELHKNKNVNSERENKKLVTLSEEYSHITNCENYRNIIVERTKNSVHFKKIICRMRKIQKHVVENRKDSAEGIEMEEHENDNRIHKIEVKKEKEETKKLIKSEYNNLGDDIYMGNETIYYLNGDVNLGLEKPIENREKNILKKIENEKDEAKAFFYKQMNENKELQKVLSIRNRFVDPLYLRRRYSYIDKLKKIKKEKKKKYRKHFLQSADEKEIWPDNKGLLNKKYPDPYS